MKSVVKLLGLLVVAVISGSSVQAAIQSEVKSENPLIESIAKIKAILKEDSYWLQNAVDPASDRRVRDILVEDLLKKMKQLRDIENARTDIRHLEELVSDNEICSSFEEMIDPSTNKSALEMVREELEGKKQELNRLLSQINQAPESKAVSLSSPSIQRVRAYGALEPMPLSDY